MITPIRRNEVRKKIHRKIRKKINGTLARPRLNIFRSIKHVYVQVIDDRRGCTLAAASSTEKSFPLKSGGIDHPRGLGRLGQMQRDDVGLGQKRVEAQ